MCAATSPNTTANKAVTTTTTVTNKDGISTQVFRTVETLPDGRKHVTEVKKVKKVPTVSTTIVQNDDGTQTRIVKTVETLPDGSKRVTETKQVIAATSASSQEKEKMGWKDPSRYDETFMRFLSNDYISEHYDTTAGHVFGNGSAGIGLYSLETKEAYYFLQDRLTKDLSNQIRRYNQASPKDLPLIQAKIVTTLPMLAYVLLRLESSGPYARLEPNKVDAKIQELAKNSQFNTTLIVDMNIGKFSYDDPRFPEEVTGYRQGEPHQGGIGGLSRVDPMRSLTYRYK